MAIGNRLIDPNYIPENPNKENILETYMSIGAGKCPVKFTEDPIEYCESEEFVGIKLRRIQREFVRDLYSVNEKGHQNFSEAVLISGMRSGKSVCAGLIATFQVHRLLSMDNPAKDFNQLVGDRITVQCIASSQDQAGETIYAKVEAIVNSSYWWKTYIEWLQKKETAPGGKGIGSIYQKFSTSIEFKDKNIAILALHSNSASLAGKTSACCVFDELSRFDVAEGNVQAKSQKKSAQAVYNTASRSITSLMPFSKVVTITSPMYEDDYGMQLLLRSGTFKGGEHSAIVEALRSKVPDKSGQLLGYHFTTFEVNPSIDENGNTVMGGTSEDMEFFKSKKAQDPEAYNRDYLAIPPSAISPYIEYPERLLNCINKVPTDKVTFADRYIEDMADVDGAYVTRQYIAKYLTVLSSDRTKKYYLCADGGETRDSFVIGMAHGEQYTRTEKDVLGNEVEIPSFKIMIDFIEAWIPDKQRRITVNFKNVEETIFKLTQAFNVKSVSYDQWQSVESIQSLFSKGVNTEKIGANLEMYETLKQMIYTNKVSIPDDEKLFKELRQLNLLKGLRVDHPSGGSKDRADVLCRLVWKVHTEYIKEAYQGDHMLPMGTRFPTIRSIATAYDQAYQEENNGGVFGQGNSIFGEGFMVKGNIMPNFNRQK